MWLGGYTSYFVWLDVPDGGASLADRVASGADVRFLLGDPESPATAERERVEASPLTLSTRIAITQAEIGKLPAPPEVRLTDRHLALSVWVFDDDLIVATHIGALLGQESVTMYLRRRQTGGAFDRYCEHFVTLWEDARPG